VEKNSVFLSFKQCFIYTFFSKYGIILVENNLFYPLINTLNNNNNKKEIIINININTGGFL